MTQPTYIAVGSLAATATNAATLTVSPPNGAIGDLLVLVLFRVDGTAAPTVSGWTPVPGATAVGGSTAISAGTYYKIATSATGTADNTPAITFGSSTVHRAGVVVRYRNADPSRPIRHATILYTASNAATISTTNITSTSDNCLAAFIAVAGGAHTFTGGNETLNWAAAADVTNFARQASTAGADGTIGYAAHQFPTAGSFLTPGVTWSANTTNGPGMGILLGIQEATTAVTSATAALSFVPSMSATATVAFAATATLDATPALRTRGQMSWLELDIPVAAGGVTTVTTTAALSATATLTTAATVRAPSVTSATATLATGNARLTTTVAFAAVAAVLGTGAVQGSIVTSATLSATATLTTGNARVTTPGPVASAVATLTMVAAVTAVGRRGQISWLSLELPAASGAVGAAFAATASLSAAVTVRTAVAFAATAVVSGVASSGVTGTPVTLTLDGATTYQTIDGFGVNVSAWAGVYSDLTPVLELLRTEMRSTLFAVDPYGGCNWVDTSAHATDSAWTDNFYATDTRWAAAWDVLTYLYGHGCDVVITYTGRVPTWASSGSGYDLLLAQEANYAAALASAIDYGKRVLSLPITRISVTNEMDLGSPEGPSMTIAQFIRLQNAVDDRLGVLGYSDVEFVSPATGGYANTQEHFREILADAQAGPATAALSMHNYDVPINVGNGAISIDESSHPDRRFWLAEWSQMTTDGNLETTGHDASDEWTFAQVMTQNLLGAMDGGTIYGPTAALAWEAWDCVPYHTGSWTYFGLFDYSNHDDTAGGTYTRKKRYYTNAQVFRGVLPGWQRISATANNGNVIVQAYTDGAGGITVTGYNGTGGTIALNGTLSNLGTPSPAVFEHTETSSTLNLGTQGAVGVGGSFSASILADTFFTLTNVPTEVSVGVTFRGSAGLSATATTAEGVATSAVATLAVAATARADVVFTATAGLSMGQARVAAVVAAAAVAAVAATGVVQGEVVATAALDATATLTSGAARLQTSGPLASATATLSATASVTAPVLASATTAVVVGTVALSTPVAFVAVATLTALGSAQGQVVATAETTALATLTTGEARLQTPGPLTAATAALSAVATTATAVAFASTTTLTVGTATVATPAVTAATAALVGTGVVAGNVVTSAALAATATLLAVQRFQQPVAFVATAVVLDGAVRLQTPGPSMAAVATLAVTASTSAPIATASTTALALGAARLETTTELVAVGALGYAVRVSTAAGFQSIASIDILLAGEARIAFAAVAVFLPSPVPLRNVLWWIGIPLPKWDTSEPSTKWRTDSPTPKWMTGGPEP